MWWAANSILSSLVELGMVTLVVVTPQDPSSMAGPDFSRLCYRVGIPGYPAHRRERLGRLMSKQEKGSSQLHCLAEVVAPSRASPTARTFGRRTRGVGSCSGLTDLKTSWENPAKYHLATWAQGPAVVHGCSQSSVYYVQKMLVRHLEHCQNMTGAPCIASSTAFFEISRLSHAHSGELVLLLRSILER